ncbi:hypothetical protein GCM10010331_15660 [Streptomyces xanthochromogenes]|nr:hypothetical protein GCM10010331_15660 [Streptomyces xanthochromogenes]
MLVALDVAPASISLAAETPVGTVLEIYPGPRAIQHSIARSRATRFAETKDDDSVRGQSDSIG